jgi:hypothetical protein
MKIVLLMGLIVILTGCRYAQPNFYNGRYYMAGDKNCARMKKLSDTRIMCENTDGKETGYRDAMTDQQLQMWRHNQQIQQQNQPTYTNCYKTYGGGVNCTTY